MKAWRERPLKLIKGQAIARTSIRLEVQSTCARRRPMARSRQPRRYANNGANRMKKYPTAGEPANGFTTPRDSGGPASYCTS